MPRQRSTIQIAGRPTTPLPPAPASGTLVVPVSQIVLDPKQPRKDWNHGEGRQRLDELAASISEFGVLQPLLVRAIDPLADGTPQYMVIAGARRRTAAGQAGVDAVPVVVRNEELLTIRILQLIENLQRQDLSPLDEARAYKELMDYDQSSPQAVAERLHISGQQVRDRLRILADQVLADAVERRQISATAAREISKLPDDKIEEFRARVASGESLLSNDVARARAELRAAGVAHPRRKVDRGQGKDKTSFYPMPPQTMLGLGLTAAEAQQPASHDTEPRHDRRSPVSDTRQEGSTALPVGEEELMAQRTVLAARLSDLLAARLQTAPDMLVALEEALARPDAGTVILEAATGAVRRVRERLRTRDDERVVTQ